MPVGGGRFVTLGELGYVSDGAAEQRSFARLDGRPVVGFQVSKTRRASDIAVEDAVAAAVAALAAEQSGVTFTKVVSTVTDTRDSYASTVTVLMEGMALAAIVVFVFLRDWRSTAISALAMPISLIPTFIVMSFLGFTLNTLTLLGLTLVVGILVDDAIVEIENIEKRIERGERPYEAALRGADAIGLAVVTTTFAIVAVFAPVSLIGGAAGQYFTEFGATVSIAVLFSLLVARMLTPLMAAYFLSPSGHPQGRKPFTGWYRGLLEFALRRRGLSVIAALAFLLGSALLASTLPTGFVPEGNPDTVPLRVQGPSGASPTEMSTAVAQLDRALRAVPEVRSVFVEVGSGGDPAAGSAMLVLDPARSARTSAVKRTLRAVLVSVPDLRVSMTPDLEMVLTGSDDAALARAAKDLERQMRGGPGLRDVRPAVVPSASEVLVRPRVAEAARLGVSAETIATTVRVATTGDADANVAKASVGGRRLPIRVLVADVARGDLAAIGALRVAMASGSAVPLAAVADLSVESGPSRIERFDRLRRASVQADLDGITLGQATTAIADLPVMRSLPVGVSQAAYGDTQAMAELFGGFAGAMAAGVGLIFAVLVLLFGSFFKPVTILTALPLSIGGAVIGLWLFGIDFNLPALIGILMLLGLAAKNSILLVEFAIEAERGGMSQHDALIEACRERARPIVMTTVAMGAGMVPAAIGLADTGGFMRPMAIVVIGGLVSSTALSLVLVPVVYACVDDFELWLGPRLARLVTPREAPTSAA